MVGSGAADVDAVVASLVDWFQREGADLPWRRTRDRYRIHVAETQLQATPVSRVLSYCLGSAAGGAERGSETAVL